MISSVEMISGPTINRIETQLRLLYDALARSEALEQLDAYIAFLEEKRAQLRAVPTRVLEGPAREGFGRTLEERIEFAGLILSARKTARGIAR